MSFSAACSARFATALTGRPNLAAAVARTAAELGTDLMPHQRLIAETGTELEGGKLAYRQVTALLPRQSGKSTLALALMVTYALARPGQRILYSAQTRLDARARLTDDWMPLIRQSRFAPLVTERRAMGGEALLFANGSRIGLVAGTRTGGHGQVLDLAVCDEAWAHTDSRLETGVKPTMITRPDPQIWIVSTAGDATSTCLRAKVDAGRLAAETGISGAAAYLEWSAPSGDDPSDPAVWWRTMPALAAGLVTEAAVRADLELMGLAEWRRAYLNQWPDETAAGWLAFDQSAWEACGSGPVPG